MRFAKIGLERNLCFLDQRKMIPGIDGFAELSSIVDDVVCLQDILSTIIGTVYHVYVFKKVFNFIENIFDWGDWVIVNLGHFPFNFFDLSWQKNPHVVIRYEKICHMFPVNCPVYRFFIAITYCSLTAVDIC